MNRYLVVAGILAASLVVAPQASLRGSHASMVKQNRVANRQHLSRIKDDRELATFKRAGRIKPLPVGKGIKIDRRLAPKFRFARPRVNRYLVQLGRKYYRRFHASLKVTSAVRTVAYQHKLIRTNPNAARGTTQLTQSSHPTGATFDITKVPMSRAEVRWVRVTLLRDERVGLIEATEEFRQKVFHVMVLR